MEIKIFATYHDIYDERPNFEKLKDILNLFNPSGSNSPSLATKKRMPLLHQDTPLLAAGRFIRKSLLGILMKLDSVLHKNGYLDIESQQFFINSFFPVAKREHILKILGDIGRRRGKKFIYVFTQQQTHNLIKLAIVHCKDDTVQNNDVVAIHIGDMFLLMNNFYDSLMKDEENKDEALKYIIRNTLYNADDALRKRISRIYKLFVVIPLDLGINNWNDSFLNITGLPIEKYMAIAFSFLAHWNQINIGNIADAHPFINKDTYFRNTILTREDKEKALDIFCDDIDISYEHISRQIDSSKNWQLEFTYQKNKPLFEMQNNEIGNHGLSFIIDKMTENIYWTILDNLNADEGKAFLKEFGEIFEYYVCDILKRTFGKKAYDKIYYGRDNKEAADCIIVIQRNVFIFEIKSGRLIKDIHITGNMDTLFDQFREKLIIRQLIQISKVIEDFKNGAFTVGELTYDQIVRIYPVCVTFQDIPQLLPIRDRLNEIVNDGRYFEDDKIQPFQILDSEEVELIEALFTTYFKRQRFLNLMQQKCGDKRLRSYSFKNFILEKTAFDVSVEESEEVKRTFHNATDKFAQLTFGKGLDS